MISIFFFQAEDGIRDWSVTGVQTCALPILPLRLFSVSRLTLTRTVGRRWPLVTVALCRSMTSERSEERRVGKECGCLEEEQRGEKGKYLLLQGRSGNK